MVKKIDIGQKAKVQVVWNVSPVNYSKELKKSIISAMAKKYGIPEKNIKVEPNLIVNTSNGSLAADSVKSINDPQFQLELFKQYISENKIEDIDFNEIVKIDSQINSLIDYSVYDKGKKYSIKWVKWNNFLSYGPDNFFDFTTLHGLVLLNGEPANKSGKSTFAYDLLHFLLFGKTNTNKAKTLGDLFNNYLPDERTITVEGCINIDGDDFIIKRTLTRPAAGKKTKTVTNKVEYYRLMSDGSETLLEDENQQGESAKETNKIIKEALGNESDFDLIISANAKDLDSLISLTETEKGRLLSRWIGLSVIEDKDAKAREKWNKEISVGRYSDIYNKVQLENEISELEEENKSLDSEINESKKIIKESDKKLETFSKTRDALLSSKQTIDESLLNVNVTTLEATINSIIESGKKKNLDLEYQNGELAKYKDVEYSEDEYKKLKKEKEELVESMAELRTNIKHLQETNLNLEKAEFCPTCHRKFENIDNSAVISENKKKITEMTNDGISKSKRKEKVDSLLAEIEVKIKNSQEKSKIELKIATIKSDIASKRLEYSEKKKILDEVNKNKEAIAKNGEIDASINLVNSNIKNEEWIKEVENSKIASNEKDITKNKELILQKKSFIVKIDEERKTEKYWKLYLQMIGKDGISKMVLRNTLPIINCELNRLLGDVTDFDVEITMNDKNDVDFLLIRNGVVTRLSAASGLEKTQASLALRVVLGRLSTLSRPPFILLDEVLGTVAKENYDDMKKLYDKISEYYDFILHITHLTEIVDWHNTIVTVKKENNISSIKTNS